MPDVSDVREIIATHADRVALPVPTSRPSESRSGRLCWHQVELQRSHLSPLLPTRDDSSRHCVRHHSRHHLEPHTTVYRWLSLPIDTHVPSRSLTIKNPAVAVRGDLWRSVAHLSAVARDLFEHLETLLSSWNAHNGASERCSGYIPGLRLDKKLLPSLLCNKRTTTTLSDEDSNVCRPLRTRPCTCARGNLPTCSTSRPAPCAGGVQQDVDHPSSERAGSCDTARKTSSYGRAATESQAPRDSRRGGTPGQGRAAASDGSAERAATLDPLANRTTQAREVPVSYTTLTLARAPRATIWRVNSATSRMISSSRTSR